MQSTDDSAALNPSVVVPRPVSPRASVAFKIAAAGLVALGIAAAAVLAFINSGMYDIAATTPHFDVTHKLVRTLMERSIQRHARDVKVPDLDDPEKVHSGFKNFNAMCVTCHGAPGAAASEIAKGLYPAPPDLAEAAKGWTSAELYVIIKNGIKMSGMPAWEQSHSGDEIWALVAFLKVLPTMSANEYREAAEYYERQEGGMAH
jgi:mono/diheme cytochrome c family protein